MFETGFNTQLVGMCVEDIGRYAIDFGRFLAGLNRNLSRDDLRQKVFVFLASMGGEVVQKNEEIISLFLLRVWYGYMLEVNVSHVS